MKTLLITQIASPKAKLKPIRAPTQTKALNEKKENFLNYLINEKTRFADLEKIEEYYHDTTMNTYKRYNLNKSRLEEKRREYDNVLNEIQLGITLELHVTESNLLQLYDDEIEKKRALIRTKEHDLECYSKMYSRYYKSHYLIQKRFDDETDYEEANNHQYDKYALINNHAQATIAKQTSMLNDLRLFIEVSNRRHSKEIADKTAAFNELNAEVTAIKKDIESIDNLITGIQLKRAARKKHIATKMNENEKIKKETSFSKVEYYLLKKQLLEIYHLLDVKSLDDLIDKFKLSDKESSNFNINYVCLNKDIVSLNNSFTAMEAELIHVNEAILLKPPQAEQPVDSYDSLSLEKTVKESHFDNDQLIEAYKAKETIFKKIFAFMLNYRRLIADSLKTTTFPNHFHSSQQSQGNSINAAFQYLFLSNSANKMLFEAFNEFINSVYTLLSCGFNKVSIELLMSNSFKKRKYEAVNLFSDLIVQCFENQAEGALSRFEKHKNQNVSNELLNGKEGKPKKVIDQLQEVRMQITKGVLYSDYIEFLNSNQLSVDKQELKLDSSTSPLCSPLKDQKADLLFMRLHPNRSLLLMDQYTNELVLKSRPKEKTSSVEIEKTQGKLFKRKEFALISAHINDEEENSYIGIEEYQSKRETKPKGFQTNHNKANSINTNSTNSSATSKTKSKESSKGPMKTRMPNSDMNRIYSRLNDLRKLEFHYFKSNEKDQLKHNDFNEMYMNFRKKYLVQTTSANKSAVSLFPTKSSINLNGDSPNASIPHLPQLKGGKGKEANYD